MLRSNFYRDNYRRLAMFCVLLVFIAIGLMGWVFYERTHKNKTLYYATTSNGNLLSLERVPKPDTMEGLESLRALSQPNLTTPALLDWSQEAATTVYNFNFENYQTALRNVRSYFTDAGYQNFLAALSGANTLDQVESKRLFVSAVATNTPVVLKEGPTPDGTYAWQVQLPMLITFQSASDVTKQDVIMTMLIARRSTLESPKGIGIASMTIKNI